jgi:hypothetical protein
MVFYRSSGKPLSCHSRNQLGTAGFNFAISCNTERQRNPSPHRATQVRRFRVDLDARPERAPQVGPATLSRWRSRSDHREAADASEHKGAGRRRADDGQRPPGKPCLRGERESRAPSIAERLALSVSRTGAVVSFAALPTTDAASFSAARTRIRRFSILRLTSRVEHFSHFLSKLVSGDAAFLNSEAAQAPPDFPKRG